MGNHCSGQNGRSLRSRFTLLTFEFYKGSESEEFFFSPGCSVLVRFFFHWSRHEVHYKMNSFAFPNRVQSTRLRHNPKQITNQQTKGKYKYLQKYYHCGPLYLNEESDVYKRNFAEPTLEDHFDKTLLPKVMQVKEFGRAGRTKYSQLVDQVTAEFEIPGCKLTASTLSFRPKGAELDNNLKDHPGRSRECPRQLNQQRSRQFFLNLYFTINFHICLLSPNLLPYKFSCSSQNPINQYIKHKIVKIFWKHVGKMAVKSKRVSVACLVFFCCVFHHEATATQAIFLFCKSRSIWIPTRMKGCRHKRFYQNLISRESHTSKLKLDVVHTERINPFDVWYIHCTPCWQYQHHSPWLTVHVCACMRVCVAWLQRDINLL